MMIQCLAGVEGLVAKQYQTGRPYPITPPYFFWKKVAVTKLENNEPVIHPRSEPKQFYK